jgi:DNA repair exonuclease SbcCD ATPase subunit
MMGTAGIAWIVAALCGAFAVALFARLRQLTVEVNEARIGAEKLEGELRASREQRERESAKLRRKSDELADLRKRHDKLRKRKDGADARSGGQPASSGAVSDRELEEARQARDRAREEAAAATRELEELRVAHAEALASAKPPPDALSPDEAEKLRNEVSAAHESVASAQESVKTARADTEAAERMVQRLRKRLQAQETAYVSLRGELEAKKDRLATQNEELERLRALKVTWVDAGGESGDAAGLDDATDSGATAATDEASREAGVASASEPGSSIDPDEGGTASEGPPVAGDAPEAEERRADS